MRAGPTSGPSAAGCAGAAVVVGVAFAAFLGAMALLTLLVTVIWPGEAGLTARWLCDADRPDHVVVATTSQTDDGTSTDFTLYCVGERGDAVDIGWARPWRILWVAHTVLVGVPMAWVVARKVAAVRRRAGPGPGG